MSLLMSYNEILIIALANWFRPTSLFHCRTNTTKTN